MEQTDQWIPLTSDVESVKQSKYPMFLCTHVEAGTIQHVLYVHPGEAKPNYRQKATHTEYQQKLRMIYNMGRVES